MDGIGKTVWFASQIAYLVLFPWFTFWMVFAFQELKSKDSSRFAWKAWGAFTLTVELPALWALLFERTPGALITEWWPWSGLVSAPIEAFILVVIAHVLLLKSKPGSGFAWKSWALVAVLVFFVQSIGIQSWKQAATKVPADKTAIGARADVASRGFVTKHEHDRKAPRCCTE